MIGGLSQILALTACLAGTPGQSARVRMLVPGDFHGWEVKLTSTGDYLGLYASEGGFELRLVRPQVEPVFDPYMDGPGDTTGRVVTAGGEDAQPLFMLLPPEEDAGLSGGPVATVLVDSPMLHADTTLSLGEYGSLQVTAKGVFLAAGASRQRLSSVHPVDLGEGVNVVWAGDLDRDGRIDVLLDDRPHYACRMNYRLFLSGPAIHGRLVQEVASVFSVSC